MKLKTAGISRSLLTILFASAWMASAQQNVSVTSTTDGNGLYSYTFNLGSSSDVWGVSPDNGDIYMQSHGIIDVINPPGWTDTVDANGFITWQPASGTVYVGQPSLTFSVLSSDTDSTLYNQWGVSDPTYLEGAISGTLFTLPDYQGVSSGYETFSYLGPQAVPEPSSFALIGFAFLLMKPFRRFLTPAKR
jgi:hypothetical protein